jgi:hypothetical protein
MVSFTAAPVDSRYLKMVPTGAARRRAELTGVGLEPTRNRRCERVRPVTAGAGLTATENAAGVDVSVPSDAWKVNRSLPENRRRGV